VLAPELASAGVEPEHWARLGRVLAAVAARLGPWPTSPEALARLLEEAAPGLRADMDPIAQLLALARAGAAAGLPVPPALAALGRAPFLLLQAAFDRLWPDGTTLVLYAVDVDLDAVWTSLVLRKERGDVALLGGDGLLGEQGLRAARWREDVPRLLGALAGRVGPAHAALFFTRDGLLELLAAPRPLACLARLRARREALLTPWPWRLAAPLALLGAVLRARELLRPHEGGR